MAYRPRGHRKQRPARGKPSSFVWVTHPPAPAGCRVLHFELLATGPGSGHLSAHATGAGRDGLTLVGGKGKRRRRETVPDAGAAWPRHAKLTPGCFGKSQASPHPGGVGHVLRRRAGPKPPLLSSHSYPTGAVWAPYHQAPHSPFVSPCCWKAIEGSKAKNQSAAGVARGGADTTLGLKPDTRRGYGVAARPRTLPPALPDTRCGNGHS